ncbi:MAG: chorismate synthase [Clostridia bacterium]
MSSIWGKRLKISLFGESHGPSIGIVVDGFPAGIKIDEAFILSEMKRRAPGGESYSTKRNEADYPEIQSGVFNGFSTGSPICAVIQNADTHSTDYSELINKPRPGHADYTGRIRYQGFNDFRGGGHFSGRLTAPMVFAGALCKLALRGHGVTIGAHILQVGSIQDDRFEQVDQLDFEKLTASRFPVLNEAVAEKMQQLIRETAQKKDSVGGIVQCAAIGLDAGIGNPIFDTIEGNIASFMFSIPAVKGVEFGAGFRSAEMFGSQNNDAFRVVEGKIITLTNNAGGLAGGISSGMPILFNVAFKPTPSIYLPQETVDLESMTVAQIAIKGRHDPCVVPRAVPVVEAGCAIALLDLLV